MSIANELSTEIAVALLMARENNPGTPDETIDLIMRIRHALQRTDDKSAKEASPRTRASSTKDQPTVI